MILQLDHVNSYYDKSHILFDLSLDVEEGDSVCILGRNGVGKTTTMKTIMGMLNPKVHAHAEGSIVFDGAQINGQPSYKISRRGIAYVPQGRHVFPTLTTRENLTIAERTGVNGEKAWTIEKIYQLFPRLKEREEFKGDRLSGGEQQMLAVARGLMQNARLLLLDEITEGLAPIVVKELERIISELRKHGVTILLAEQNVNFALATSHNCYIIEKGHIVYKGLTTEIPKETLSKYLGL